MVKLSADECELLRAYYFKGMKQEQIADVFGKPLGTVGVQLSRALKKLREEIGKTPDLMKELKEALR